MEKQELPQQNQQQTQSSPEDSAIEERVKIVEKKKKKFLRFVRLFLIIVVGSGAMAIGTQTLIALYHAKRKPYIVPTPVEVPDDGNGDGNGFVKREKYQSDVFKLSLEYPGDADIQETEETSEDPKKLTVSLGDENEGYTFAITLLDTPNIAFEDIARIKMEAFKQVCPSTASFSEISDTFIDTIDAKTFTVKNCDADYKVNFVPRFGVYYELTQMFWGDIGYRQQYATTTETILSGVTFYDIEMPPEDPLITYYNKNYRFKFTHPRLDAGCCVISGPESDTIKTQVVLADDTTVQDSETFDGLGIFIETSNSKEGYETIGSYISTQKQLLISTYKITTGNSPTTEENQIKVGDMDAVLLKGYSWKGNDLIFLDLPYKRDYMIISVNNISGEFYEKTLNDLLASFEFNVIE